MKFKLTKITGKLNRTPSEFIGESLIIHGEGRYLVIEKDVESLHDIINAGDRVQIINEDRGYILTSQVNGVILMEDVISFETKNSIYKLEILND